MPVIGSNFLQISLDNIQFYVTIRSQ